MGAHMDDATYKKDVSTVWRVTVILSIITIFEVAIAMLHIYSPGFQAICPRIVLNIIFIIASIGKAFYIIAEFMHLRHEKKVLIVSLGVPLIFLVWAIIAFMHEANAWNHMKTLGGFGQ
ncbi:MAG: cytochrome C oxidase subunit IV family protein [Bacteroidetes bacterium]|nr:cytochrome C oxidase subunit IV family protein [Bacteroidota bacterium]